MKTRGFTLVELLVVITIIGILIALLLPAVQAAREAARRVQCSNQLKQMALACLHCEQSNGAFPTGGWGYCWAGEPGRGFDGRQPGGWQYNLLPYTEQQALHDMGATASDPLRAQRVATPLAGFYCPSRRNAVAYPFLWATGGYNYCNVSPQPPTIGRSDYAACGGDYTFAGPYYIPRTLPEGDGVKPSTWADVVGGANHCTGVFFVHSATRIADIPDGTANTYLAGEKYCNPDHYSDGVGPRDDQGWDIGWDGDNVRWTYRGSSSRPCQDQPGLDQLDAFGAAHPDSFNMAFCDGSVHGIPYTIDAEVHHRMGSRADGLQVDGGQF